MHYSRARILPCQQQPRHRTSPFPLQKAPCICDQVIFLIHQKVNSGLSSFSMDLMSLQLTCRWIVLFWGRLDPSLPSSLRTRTWERATIQFIQFGNIF
jgi:hypothetical protein